MPTWSFHIVINESLTREQAAAFDHWDMFGIGAVGCIFWSGDPELRPIRSDPELLQLPCDIEAPTLLDAVAQVARELPAIPGLRAVGVVHQDMVVLKEAAQRCDRSEESLERLARERRGAGGFPEPVSDPGPEFPPFYSWREIAGFLRSIGDTVPEQVPELVVADLALRLAEAVRETDVPPGSLRALGLRDDD
ncbi:hypothetical protein NX801_24630 [Streptomyces sp. LP05-1]|uniref:Uncharacterized protein n=1 Tax=Streptomyces pyxinae TaxID=2970734 RepID=A0ABT2CMZ0_9ACTN|nr:hypothetical protein [Streptomyces sp. LP05-1]MCS0638784.1 hypothetical protein [Streptomyces sp. LP05-1]